MPEEEHIFYIQWQIANDGHDTPLDDFITALAQTDGPTTDQIKSIFRERVDYGSEGVHGWRMNDPVGTEMSMTVLGELIDGRWFALECGNDYTGWGCQDFADLYIGKDRIDAVLNGLTTEGRSALGIEIDIAKALDE